MEKYGLPNITVKQPHLSQGCVASVIPSGDLARKCMVSKHGSSISFYKIFHFDQLPFHSVGKRYVGQGLHRPLPGGALCFLRPSLEISFSQSQADSKCSNQSAIWGWGEGGLLLYLRKSICGANWSNMSASHSLGVHWRFSLHQYLYWLPISTALTQTYLIWSPSFISFLMFIMI